MVAAHAERTQVGLREIQDADDVRRQEDHQLGLVALFHLPLERQAQERDIAQNRDLLIHTTHVLSHQTSQHHRLPIGHRHRGLRIPASTSVPSNIYRRC